ncbi:MAG TPA: isoprenylcysteine carboxylmethyltransferase family protein [Candidatus Eremiobacteraceae bacterium]|nr:isoprenylcysteine carboxylmethyltransferase family protein [Candidatus Eremiobacteraceae bacterium]
MKRRQPFGALVVVMLGMAALIFIPAWTLHYWQAWTFLAVYFFTSVAVGIYLVRKDPALLERRMSGGPAAENETSQKIIMSIAFAGFVGLLVVPALDHRFGWSHMSAAAAIAGDCLVALGWFLTFLVFKENSFSSAIIEVAPDQKVVTTGPYAIVRHPMYAAGVILLAGFPIALGSWWGLLVLAAILPVLLWRLFDEEAFLAENLPGYVEYQAKVKHRLIPFIW